MFKLLLLLGASSGAALLVSPRPAHISRPVIRLARPTALEPDPPPPETEKQQLNDAQFGVLERAQDPFRLIRLVVYGIFGVVSVAGISIAVYDLGKDPGTALVNLGTNVVLGGAVGAAFYFDKTVVQEKIKDNTRKEVDDPMLKGDSEFFFAEKAKDPGE